MRHAHNAPGNKTLCPSRAPTLIVRPRLSHQLDAVWQPGKKLALIAAPPGFGKTTVVAHWLASNRSTPSINGNSRSAAWLALDPADNDPTRFWTYFIAAAQTINAGFGRAALASLESPTPPSAEAILTSLLNEFAAADPGAQDSFLIVLDDYHVIENRTIHDALAFLLDYLPPNAHLVLTTRVDPPIPLSRLRARNEMVELRVRDLRFTDDEASAFLTGAMHLNLSLQDAHTLTATTEGWIAGLQLAALSCRGRDDLSEFIRSFAGSHRYVLDYLIQEVLERQTPEIETFLLNTCVLDRLNADLINFVLEREDTQTVLERLESANLFVMALDDARRWYRYHHLFADMLRARLKAVSPARIPALHTRASEWFAASNLIPEAITHALAAEVYDRAAQLIAQNALGMVLQGQLATVTFWLDQLPPRAWELEPRLELVRGWGYIITTENSSVEAGLVRLENALNSRPELDSPALRGEIASQRAIARSFLVAPDALPTAQAALQIAPDVPFIRVPLIIALANALYASGLLRQADQTLMQLLARLESSGAMSLQSGLRTILIRIWLAQGRWREAAQNASVIQKFLEDNQATSAAGAAMIYAQQGVLAYQSNRLAEADEYLDTAIELAHRTRGFGNELFALAQRAFVAQARGDSVRALADMNQAITIARRYQPTFATLTSFYGRLAELHIRQGNLAAADAWAAEPPIENIPRPTLSPYDHDRFARVKLALAHAQWDDALDQLNALESAARESDHGAFLVTAMLLTALTHAGRGDRLQSFETLERALAFAQPEGYIRAFLDEGEPLQKLGHALRAHLKSQKRAPSPYLEIIVAAFASPTSPIPAAVPQLLTAPALVEPLSDRELQVLRLLNDGFSNREISEKLFLAIGTVKKHLNNIYGKLAVQTRTEALARARALHLI